MKQEKRRVPFEFLVEALGPLNPEVKPMFSGYAVYSGNRILCMLRDKPLHAEDNGMWLVLAEEVDLKDGKFGGLKGEIPSLRRIGLLGEKIGHWLLIPADEPEFESESIFACERMLARDPRIGRVPESRKKKTVAKKAAGKQARKAPGSAAAFEENGKLRPRRPQAGGVAEGRDARVDAYIAGAGEFAQPILRHIRQLVHKGCPGVAETMKWSRPFFEFDGKVLANMAAFKAHCSFGFWGEEMAEVLRNAGAVKKGAMGTLGRIRRLEDLPADEEMVAWVKEAAASIRQGEQGSPIGGRRVVKDRNAWAG